MNAFKFLDEDSMFILCTIMDVATKGLFAQTAMDCQLTALNSLEVELKTLAQASNKRHIFLKFLLHEVSSFAKPISSFP